MVYNTMEADMQVKVTRIGNSTGVILPKELLTRLRLERGDELTLTETPGGFTATAGDATFVEGLEISRKFARQYRDALAELAKR